VQRPPSSWLSRDDRTTLALWLASRVAIGVGAIYASWLLLPVTAQFHSWTELNRPVLTPIYMWRQWDVYWYTGIAERGYGSAGLETAWAFMPGLPTLMGLAGRVGVPAVHAGLIISFVAGAVACLGLARLAVPSGSIGSRAVLAWVASPYALFLFVPYAEALFCAFAFWSWVVARNGQWIAAGALASAATLVRVNGVFLAVALGVLLLTTQRTKWRHGWALLLPIASLLGYVAFGWLVTGNWTVWLASQAEGWDREFAWPWGAAANTVIAMVDAPTTAEAVSFLFESVGAVVLVALVVWLLAVRRWAEATLVGLTAMALLTNEVWYSVFRSTLVLFPLWVLLGLWMTRNRFFAMGYVAVCGPLMVVAAVGYTNAMWIG